MGINPELLRQARQTIKQMDKFAFVAAGDPAVLHRGLFCHQQFGLGCGVGIVLWLGGILLGRKRLSGGARHFGRGAGHHDGGKLRDLHDQVRWRPLGVFHAPHRHVAGGGHALDPVLAGPELGLAKDQRSPPPSALNNWAMVASSCRWIKATDCSACQVSRSASNHSS